MTVARAHADETHGAQLPATPRLAFMVDQLILYRSRLPHSYSDWYGTPRGRTR